MAKKNFRQLANPDTITTYIPVAFKSSGKLIKFTDKDGNDVKFETKQEAEKYLETIEDIDCGVIKNRNIITLFYNKADK